MWSRNVLVALAMAASLVSAAQPNGNSTAKTFSQLTEKLISKLSSNLFSNPNNPKARGYDWGYLEGYSNELYGKSDYSWIVPLIIVVGFGTLLIPLMGTLMTTMVTQGTINLTAGRRRKRHTSIHDFLNDSFESKLKPLMELVEGAFEKFNKKSK